jgi:H+-transporting ATPase
MGYAKTIICSAHQWFSKCSVVGQAGGFGALCELAGGFAGVIPEHKHRVMTALQGRGHFVGMTGDGVNDAPALSIANVVIAVAGATDAARGASDIILQQEGLSTIVKAIYGARIIFKRIEFFCPNLCWVGI